MVASRILFGAAVLCLSTPIFGVNLNLETLKTCSCVLEGSAVDDAKSCSSDRTHSLVSQEPAQGQNLPLLFPFSLEATSKASVETTPMCNCDCPSRNSAFSCHLEPQQDDTDGSKNQVALAYHVGNLPADAIAQYIKSFCIPAIVQLNTVVKACPGAQNGDGVSCNVLNGGKPDAVVVMATSGDAASCKRTKDAIAGAICRRDPSLCKLSDKLACMPQGGSVSHPAAHTIGAALGGNGLSVTNCLSVAAGLNSVLSKHAAGEYEDCGVTTTTATTTTTTITATTATTTTTVTTVTATTATDTSTTTTCTGAFYTSCPASSQFVISACYETCSKTSELLGSIVSKCYADLDGDVDGLVRCSGDDVILAGVDGDTAVDCEDFASGLSQLVERQFGTLKTDVRTLFTCGKHRVGGQPKTGFLQVTESKEEGAQCSDVTGAMNAMLKAYADTGACPSRFTETTTTVSTTTVSTTTATTTTTTSATTTTVTTTTITGTTKTSTTRSSTTTTTITSTTVTTTTKTTTASTTTYTGTTFTTTTVTTTTVTTKTVTTKTATTTATITTTTVSTTTKTTTTTTTTATSTTVTVTTTTSTTTIKCTNFFDNKWVDRDGDACSVYSSPEACKLYGNGYRGLGGFVANQACCSCGGGVKLCSGDYDTRQECHRPGYDIPTTTTVTSVTATTKTTTTVTTTTTTATTSTTTTTTATVTSTTTTTATTSTATTTTVTVTSATTTTATTITTITTTTVTSTTTATTSTISSTTGTVSSTSTVTTSTVTTSTATSTTVTATTITTTTEDPIADLECFVPGGGRRLRLRKEDDGDGACDEYKDTKCEDIDHSTECCDESRCDTKEIETGIGTIKFCVPKPTTTATTVTTLTTTTAPGADKIAVVSIPNDSPVTCEATVKELDSTLTGMCDLDSKTKIECKRLSATHQMWFAGAGCPDATHRLKQLTGQFWTCLDGFIVVLKTECEDVLQDLETTLAKVHAGEEIEHGCPTTTTATTTSVTTTTTSTASTTTITSTTTTSSTSTVTSTTNTDTTEKYERGSCEGKEEPTICGAVYGTADCKQDTVLAKYLRETCREMCGTCPTTTTASTTTTTSTTTTASSTTTTTTTATTVTTTTIYQRGHCAGEFEADICGKTYPFVKAECKNETPLGDHIRKTCRAMCDVCPDITTTTLTTTTTTATVTSSTVTSSTVTSSTITSTTATTVTATNTTTTATNTTTSGTTTTTTTITATTVTTRTKTTTTSATTTSSSSTSTTSSTTTTTITKSTTTTTSATVSSTTTTESTTTTASSTTVTKTKTTTTLSSTTTTTTTTVTSKTATTYTTTTATTTTTLPCLDADYDIATRLDSNFEAFMSSDTAVAIDMPDAFRGSCGKMNTLCRTTTPLDGVFYRDWSLFQQCLLAFCPQTCGMCGLSTGQQSWRNQGVQTTCTSLVPFTTTATKTTATTQTTFTYTTTTTTTTTGLPLVDASENNMGSTDKVVIYIVVGVMLLVLIGVYALNSKSSTKSRQQYEVAMRAAAMQGGGGGGGHPAMTLSPDGDIVLNNMYSNHPGPGGPSHSGSPPGSPGGGGGGLTDDRILSSQRSEVFGKLAASILNDEPTARSGHGTASVVTIDETGL